MQIADPTRFRRQASGAHIPATTPCGDFLLRYSSSITSVIARTTMCSAADKRMIFCALQTAYRARSAISNSDISILLSSISIRPSAEFPTQNLISAPSSVQKLIPALSAFAPYAEILRCRFRIIYVYPSDTRNNERRQSDA